MEKATKEVRMGGKAATKVPKGEAKARARTRAARAATSRPGAHIRQVVGQSALAGTTRESAAEAHAAECTAAGFALDSTRFTCASQALWR